MREWTADAAVVAEPTDLTVVVGQRGFAWIEVVTEGRAAHGSRPREGRDAILRMGACCPAWERLDRELQSRPEHPFLGTGSLHASLVEGGRELLELSRPPRAADGAPPAHGRARGHRAARGGRAAGCAARGGYRVRGLARASTLGRARVRDAGRPSAAGAARGEPRAPGPQPCAAAPRSGRTPPSWATRGFPRSCSGPGGAGLHGLEGARPASEVAACRDALVDLARLVLRAGLMGSEGRPYRTEQVDGFEILVGKGDDRNDTLTFRRRGAARLLAARLRRARKPRGGAQPREPRRPAASGPGGGGRAGRVALERRAAPVARSRSTSAACRTSPSRAASRRARSASAAGTRSRSIPATRAADGARMASLRIRRRRGALQCVEGAR